MQLILPGNYLVITFILYLNQDASDEKNPSFQVSNFPPGRAASGGLCARCFCHFWWLRRRHVLRGGQNRRSEIDAKRPVAVYRNAAILDGSWCFLKWWNSMTFLCYIYKLFCLFLVGYLSFFLNANKQNDKKINNRTTRIRLFRIYSLSWWNMISSCISYL
jgi:hypothetical protein